MNEGFISFLANVIRLLHVSRTKDVKADMGVASTFQCSVLCTVRCNRPIHIRVHPKIPQLSRSSALSLATMLITVAILVPTVRQK